MPVYALSSKSKFIKIAFQDAPPTCSLVSRAERSFRSSCHFACLVEENSSPGKKRTDLIAVKQIIVR